MLQGEVINLWTVLPISEVRQTLAWVAEVALAPATFIALEAERSGLAEPPPWRSGSCALCDHLGGSAPDVGCACVQALHQGALEAIRSGQPVAVSTPLGPSSGWACPLVLRHPHAPPFESAFGLLLPDRDHLPDPEQLAAALGQPADAVAAAVEAVRGSALSGRQAQALKDAVEKTRDRIVADMTAAAGVAVAYARVSEGRGELRQPPAPTPAEPTDALALALSGWRSSEDLLCRAVAFLSTWTGASHVHAWQAGPADRCDRCPHRGVCRRANGCLRAVATTSQEAPEGWTRLPFSALPSALDSSSSAVVIPRRPTPDDGLLGDWLTQTGAKSGAFLRLGPAGSPQAVISLALPRLAGGLRKQLQSVCDALSVALVGAGADWPTSHDAQQLNESRLVLAAENQRLQEAVEAQNLLLASMSHELRTPLNAIIGFTELLRDGVVGDLSDMQARYLGTVESSGRHLLKLTDDLITIAAARTGNLPLRPGPCAVSHVLLETVQALLPMARSRSVTIETQLPPVDALVVADPDRLRQVTANLLSNAVKFSPAGEVVSLSAELTPAQLVIRVRDNGPGIPEDERDTIFLVFRKGRSSLVGRVDGFGLGLPLVRQLVELQGGSVELTSTSGAPGSEFTVRLPAGLAPADVAPPLTEGATPAGRESGHPSAVVYERDAAARRLLCECAASAGLAVVELEDASALAVTVGQHAPDLLVYGQIGGGTVLDAALCELREHDSTAALPIVFAGSPRLVEQALQIGVTDTATYPLDRTALARILRAIMTTPAVGQPCVALIMDDNPTYAEALARVLAPRGIHSLHARDGAEGLELARRHSPDVVLLDLMMPRLNGWQVLHALQADARTRDIPVVVLTVKPLGIEERQVLEGQCRAVVSKADFSRGELWKVLDSLEKCGTTGGEQT